MWPLLVVERSWLHHGRVALSEQFDAVLVAAQGGAPWAVEAIYRDLHPSVHSPPERATVVLRKL